MRVPIAPTDPLNLSALSLSSPHRVLIVGGAYAGISMVLNLLDFMHGKETRPNMYQLPEFNGTKSKREVEITVIDERDGFFHSVGAPLAHVSRKYTPTMWKRFAQLNELQHPSLSFKLGSVKKIDPSACIAEYVDTATRETKQHAYDYLVLASGLHRHWPAVPKSGRYDDYLRDAHELIDRIAGTKENQAGRRVVVIGGGAVGIEFAGEITYNYPSLHVTLIHSRAEVLSSEPLPTEVKQRAKTILEEEGVEVILNNRATVTPLPDGKSQVVLANGTEIIADVVLDTTQKGSASTDCLPSECVDEQGEVLVTPQLNFAADIENAERHFAAGDVVSWSGIKRAGGAMVMGQVVAANLYAAILNEEDSSLSFKKGELGEYPMVIGLAVGKQCLTSDSNGVRWGEQLMKDYFQDDLGWKMSLRYLGLTDVEEKKNLKEQTQITVTEIEPSPTPVPVAAA